MSKRLLKIKEVCEKVSFSRDKIYKMIKSGEFPKQISIGSNSVRWLEDDIDKWIDDKVEKNSQVA